MNEITERELEKTYIKNLIKPKGDISYARGILYRTFEEIRRFS